MYSNWNIWEEGMSRFKNAFKRDFNKVKDKFYMRV